jgi:8-amino-7-oxononanoate synthase
MFIPFYLRQQRRGERLRITLHQFNSVAEINELASIIKDNL